MRSRDLLLLLMAVSIPLPALAPLWEPPALGPPRPAEQCRGGACVTSGTAPARLAEFEVPLDPNRATVAELASLDGIGRKLAERIRAARPFRSLDEVARVRGVGRRKLERLRPRLRLSTTER
jgi:DNA uptake protein ComE-like DNA-binding protein